MTVPKCTSWLGHRFVGRYSTSGAPPGSLDGLKIDGLQAIKATVDALRSTTYERDVCVRCGATVEKKL